MHECVVLSQVCVFLPGAPQINGSAGPSSVNGIHTCKGELFLSSNVSLKLVSLVFIVSSFTLTLLMALFFVLLFAVSYTVVRLSAAHAKHLSVTNSFS